MSEPEGAPPDTEPPETPRQRTLGNLVILGVVAVLIGAGIWLANAIFEMRRVQDCAMAGRRNCAPITVPNRGPYRVE